MVPAHARRLAGCMDGSNDGGMGWLRLAVPGFAAGVPAYGPCLVCPAAALLWPASVAVHMGTHGARWRIRGPALLAGGRHGARRQGRDPAWCQLARGSRFHD